MGRKYPGAAIQPDPRPGIRVEVDRSALETAIQALAFQAGVYDKWILLSCKDVDEALQMAVQVKILEETVETLKESL